MELIQVAHWISTTSLSLMSAPCDMSPVYDRAVSCTQTNNIVDVLRDIELNHSPRDCYIIIVSFCIPTVCTT